ncbi:MAG: SMC-Scp complex subunit ScpB [Deltaproteobacteria bacterium]|jgi:segregation and condensation protein B
MPELKSIIESFLFVSEEPLTLEKMKLALPETDVKAIKEAVQMLKDEYDHRKGSICLVEVAGGYQLRTRPEYADWIRKIIQPSAQRLSPAALETLAIIAYKQPVMRSDIEHIRGVDAGGIIRMLLDRKLIKILGRKEIPGRPLIYATTRHFLEIFGLRDIKDLPAPKDISDLGKPTVEANEMTFPNNIIPTPDENT